jgi:lipopolysaccharide export system protein LptC
MHVDRYSRWVSRLKVLFPVAALGLLSTLFLLSRNIDTETALPFADKDVEERLRNQQVTGPFFSGTTNSGDTISFSAQTLGMPNGKAGANRAEDVEFNLSISGGAKVNITSQTAEYNIAEDLAELNGDVVITTSTDFRIISDMLTTQLSVLSLTSPGPVEATSPAGQLNAGSMVMTASDQGKPSQLIFTKVVKLIYTPKQVEE